MRSQKIRELLAEWKSVVRSKEKILVPLLLIQETEYNTNKEVLKTIEDEKNKRTDTSGLVSYVTLSTFTGIKNKNPILVK